MTSTQNSEETVEGAAVADTQVNELAESLQTVEQQHDSQLDSASEKKPNHASRPLFIYTRLHMLSLSKSPLVCTPEGMPALKDWFGSENEVIVSKKDAENVNGTGVRDRRFRRDQEDGETSSRPSFRSGLSQPSQMGNFKHQSLRTVDRERDKDHDKERERDVRDKEGQERLRNLSDKYDRERLMGPSVSGLRGKERDSAPHLISTSSTRSAAQGSSTTAVSRRPEVRDPSSKKKAGESNEDWRRGSDLPRVNRDERSDAGRRDRDERDRPRSRARDSSRPRRDNSATRHDRDRDRDRDDRDRDRERERDKRTDRERDDHRKEREDQYRRDKDLERDMEPDDPRRWRDDGKRDERMAARREREYRERLRDRAPQDTTVDSYDRYAAERRWAPDEARTKRGPGRDRKTGTGDDTRDDRRDREREREKEKEPAWMDTYVPTGPTLGILGGKASGGELDGIQAWKKGMKEREQKEKAINSMTDKAADKENGDSGVVGSSLAKDLDEIQLFKLMMKREEEKKNALIADSSSENAKAEQSTDASQESLDSRLPQGAATAGIIRHGDNAASETADRTSEIPGEEKGTSVQAREPDASPTERSSSSLLSILVPSTLEVASDTDNATMLHSSNDLSVEKSKGFGSRFFPTPLSAQATPTSHIPDTAIVEAKTVFSPVPNQSNGGHGSRLLALANRAPSAGSAGVQISPSPSNFSNGQTLLQQETILVSSHSSGLAGTALPISPASEIIRSQQGFSPFEESSTTTISSTAFSGSEGIRRTSGGSIGEKSSFGMSSDMNSHHNESFNAAGKGSRFAKFFDGKSRDLGSNKVFGHGPDSLAPSVSGLGQKSDVVHYNGVPGSMAEQRTMDDIFAMLQNSAQGARGNNNAANQSLMSLPGSGLLVQNHGPPQLPPQLHQPYANHGRMDSLYESRVEERPFVPDGMVPGLRTAPPPRSRENNVFLDGLDDPIPFGAQRLPSHQRGPLDQVYGGPHPSIYSQHPAMGRNSAVPIQQNHYRGGPSPITAQTGLQGVGQQRLPPGLANLGGRPPHDPSHYIGGPVGVAPGVMHSPLSSSVPSQPQFNNLPGGLGLGFGGPQMRGMPSHVPQQLQPPLGHNSMGGLGHHGSMDLRGHTQSQLLAMGNGLGVGGLRSGVGGFGGLQQGPAGQMQGPMVGLRQQQQPTPPHMLPHIIPPHLSQQGLTGGNSQPAHDLMALLMGGPHRE